MTTEQRPAIIFHVVGNLSMEEMARYLDPMQISAVMGGVAQVIAASKRTATPSEKALAEQREPPGEPR